MNIVITTTSMFLAITLLFLLVARMLFGIRNRASEAVGSRRPLALGPLNRALGRHDSNPQE